MEVSSGGPSHPTVVDTTLHLSVSLVFLYSELIHFYCTQVNFEDEARIKFLRLLGFSKDELEKKVFCPCLFNFSY